MFSRREIKNICGWSLTQVRVHLARLVELEYIGTRCGRFGSLYLYELLIEVDAGSQTTTTTHIGLIDVKQLKTYTYKSNLAGFNPHLTGGDGVASARVNKGNSNALTATWRPDGIAHQEATQPGVVT